MSGNPFTNSVPKAPTATPTTEPAVEQVETVNPGEPVVDAAVEAPVENATSDVAPPQKVKKPRKHPNKQMNNEQRKYILQNYATKTTNDIAQELNLTRQQVYRTINESRKRLQKMIEKLNQLPDDTPEKAEKLDKIQKVLDSLPVKSVGSGGRPAGGRKNAIDSVLEDIIAGF